MSMSMKKPRPTILLLGLAAAASACAQDPADPGSLSAEIPDGGAASTLEGTVTISMTSRTTAPPTAIGLNYWSWTYGVTLAGTEGAITALAPGVLRIGGHNNDWNGPTPFNDAEVDAAVTYARRIGAEPILQVPILADVTGAVPTASVAAAMVRHVNVDRGAGVKYFSIGNEPDLYADPTQTPTRPGYGTGDYCQAVRAFVPAMRAEDPSITILGPELSWKYQAGANDWLTPILMGCGDLFDIVSVHRYPVDPARTVRAAAAADADQFRATIASVRQKMASAGQGSKPLAFTETNLTWNGDPAVSTLEASPGTLPAGLWVADTLGVGLASGLWTTAFWSIREGWTLGFLTPDNVPRPAYQAVALFREHFGGTVLAVTSAPAGVHAYASRAAADDRTGIILVNWSDHPQRLSLALTGGGGNAASAAGAPPVVTVGPMTMTAVELSDGGQLATWTYGQAEWQGQVGPRASAASSLQILSPPPPP